MAKNILLQRKIKDEKPLPISFSGTFPVFDIECNPPNLIASSPQPHPVCSSVCPSILPSVCPLVRPSVRTSVHLSVHSSVSPLVHPKVRSLKCQSEYLSGCPSVKSSTLVEEKIEHLKQLLKDKISKYKSKRIKKQSFCHSVDDCSISFESDLKNGHKPFKPSELSKARRHKALKKMKQFLCHSTTALEDFCDTEKIRFTCHSREGIMIESVKSDGSTQVFFNNLNLKGGGKRTASQEREKKKRQRERAKNSEDETKKQKVKEQEQERLKKFRKKASDAMNEEEKEKENAKEQERLKKLRKKASDAMNEEEIEIQKEKDKERMKMFREKASDAMNEEEKEKMNAKEQVRIKQFREKASDEEKEKQKVKDKERKRKPRENVSDNEAEKLLLDFKRIKLQEHENHVKAQRQSIMEHHKSFFQAIKYGPHFYCTCCSRSFF